MDWPISWQKVKDSSDNTGGGSGSGLPVIDLSKYVLPKNPPVAAQITDASDIEVLEKLQLEGKPFIVKIAQLSDGDEGAFTCIHCLLMNYTNIGDGGAFIGSIYIEDFVILKRGDVWNIKTIDG